MDQRADALVGEDLGEQPLLDPAVDDVDARHAARAPARTACSSFDTASAGSSARCFLRIASASSTRQLAQQLARRARMPAMRGQVDQLDRPQRPGDLDGHRVGVEAVGVALAVAAQRRDDRDDVVLEQGLQQAGVDALDPAGELVIDALQDAGRVGDERRCRRRRAGRWRTALRGSRG